MNLSHKAKQIIMLIENAGYEAFVVGGCVRDFIMQRPCDDIDITTSARPDELERILFENGIKYIETGLKHGTVTAVVDGDFFEITTYRTDGTYADSRHPDNVEFVTDIAEDLSRRDFTVNAMAYNDTSGMVDIFNGEEDIRRRLIRAVGNPDKRFKEDALRIMRALRFASVLSFDIEPRTKKAIYDNKELLRNVSAERIYSELSKLLMGNHVFHVLSEYKEIIGVIIPELKAIFDVSQNTRWHIYDVWLHTCKAVEQSPEDLPLRLTMLLHDIGKAYSKTTDDNGVDHFKGHQKISAVYADKVLKRLKVSNDTYNRVMRVVPIHDMHIGTEKNRIKKWLFEIGESTLRDLIEVKRADKLAQNPEMTVNELENLNITQTILDEIIEEGEAFSLRDLAVHGNDLKALGYNGKRIGEMLSFLLQKVMDNELENDKDALLSYLKSLNK